MKQIAILGSTGSIGQSTLDIVRHFPGKFRVLGLSSNSNIEVLYRQIREFHPAYVCLNDHKAASKLKSRLNLKSTRIFRGEDGLKEIIKHKSLDQVVLAISGSAALSPLLASIEEKKDIALANKEALVMAGPAIMNKANRKKVKIIPVDSEQSAIWQCLDGEDKKKLKKIYLTASGGPFRKTKKKDFKGITKAEVLRHPRWRMGVKITVDSATLMNKGLEVLEAMFLFNVALDKIKVLIHPEAIIHSMVEFIDGVVLAQLSVTDMRIPIQFALTYPERLDSSLTPIDFYNIKSLNFQKPDWNKFPCLGLAYRAAKELGTMPCVLNAANEVSVESFLSKRLAFVAIPEVIEKVLNRHRNNANPGLNDILAADSWARQETIRVIEKC